MPNPRAGTFVKLSPTKIITALACPRKFKYRYVDGLEPVGTPSALAFGRAVHAALAAAYARQNTPMSADEVAEAFTRYFDFLEALGVNYKERESYETLREKGEALVTLWWETFRDDVLAAKVLSVEQELSYDVDVGLVVHGHPDVIEARDERLYIGDHKTAASWGENDEILHAKSIQLTAYAYLYWKVHHRLPDQLYLTVLKKTKKPEVFRYFTHRTRGDIEAFEDHVRYIAALIRFYRENDNYPQNVCRDCSWCGFNALCWELDDAAEAFTTRERRKQEPAATTAASKEAIGNGER